MRAAALLAGPDLAHRFGKQFLHLAANLILGHTLAGEIARDFAHNVVVAGLVEIGGHHFLGIGVGIRRALAKCIRKQMELLDDDVE